MVPVLQATAQLLCALQHDSISRAVPNLSFSHTVVSTSAHRIVSQKHVPLMARKVILINGLGLLQVQGGLRW